MPENFIAEQMRFIGLLTHEQKQAGYFVSQDADHVWVWKARNGKADLVCVFLYETVTIKQVREAAEKDRQETFK